MVGRNDLDLVLVLILFIVLAQLGAVAAGNIERPNVVATAEPKIPAPYSRTKRAPLLPHSLSFARVFGEHMVLQAGQPIRVWGEANPNTDVNVSFGGQKTSTSSDSKGKWLVELLPEKQNSTPQRLIAKSGGDKVFRLATARITGLRIVLSSDDVSKPVHARYAWSPFPEPAVNLVNSAGMPASPFTTQDENEVRYDVRMIWNAAPHNAFTDLVRWNDKFYCAFRIGTGHVPGPKGEDGKIQLISSVDGKKWSSIATIVEPGIDLRDPKLSIAPDGRLMVLMGGSNYEGTKLIDRASRVAFLENEDNDFSEIRRIEIDPGIAGNNDWLWRVTWENGVGYGVVYQAEKTRWGLHLVKTFDGVKYDLVKTLDLDGRPNESTVRFDEDGQMFLVIRNEDGRSLGHFGQSKQPFTKWNWNLIKQRLGGPNMIQLPDGRWLLGTRDYGETAKTVLGSLSIDGAFNTLITFPSGGDTSYPGMLLHGDKLWFSYYSSHEGRTSIYLATIALQELGITATRKNK